MKNNHNKHPTQHTKENHRKTTKNNTDMKISELLNQA